MSCQPLHITLLLGLALMSFACGTSGTNSIRNAYPSIQAGSFGEMRNVSTMGPIWFGGMVCEQDMNLARRRGVKRVIDLSTPNEKGACSIAAACERYGMEYMTAAIREGGSPSDEAVDFVMEWLSDGCPRVVDGTHRGLPTLMIDGSGGRGASFVAIYRVHWLGVPIEEALIEARRAGMRPGSPEVFVRAQVERIANQGHPLSPQ
ncbi:MAG: hypothetical protein ACI9F9_003231 [Candidatus Paceibacteria bacterium]|jgi:hypothetical protein